MIFLLQLDSWSAGYQIFFIGCAAREVLYCTSGDPAGKIAQPLSSSVILLSFAIDGSQDVENAGCYTLYEFRYYSCNDLRSMLIYLSYFVSLIVSIIIV